MLLTLIHIFDLSIVSNYCKLYKKSSDTKRIAPNGKYNNVLSQNAESVDVVSSNNGKLKTIEMENQSNF